MKISIIGETGMLGSMVKKYVSHYFPNITIKDSYRFNENDKSKFFNSIIDCDFIINCAGAIPQRATKKTNKIELEKFYKINNLIPTSLLEKNFKIIHACTDCVYKGDQNNAPYKLNSPYDSDDLYGKSKASLYSNKFYKNNINNIKVIRCSIVGPDRFEKSLYSWSLSQIKNSKVINGFVDHYWNGITTLRWAEICIDIINNFESTSPISFFGTKRISKFELIRYILISRNLDPKNYLRPLETGKIVDKSLYLKNESKENILDQLIKLRNFIEK